MPAKITAKKTSKKPAAKKKEAKPAKEEKPKPAKKKAEHLQGDDSLWPLIR